MHSSKNIHRWVLFCIPNFAPMSTCYRDSNKYITSFVLHFLLLHIYVEKINWMSLHFLKSSPKDMPLLTFRERVRKWKRIINVRSFSICCFPFVPCSLGMSPDQESNPSPLDVLDYSPTNWATQSGLCLIYLF